jgi:hypothetical protein
VKETLLDAVRVEDRAAANDLSAALALLWHLQGDNSTPARCHEPSHEGRRCTSRAGIRSKRNGRLHLRRFLRRARHRLDDGPSTCESLYADPISHRWNTSAAIGRSCMFRQPIRQGPSPARGTMPPVPGATIPVDTDSAIPAGTLTNAGTSIEPRRASRSRPWCRARR